MDKSRSKSARFTPTPKPNTSLTSLSTTAEVFKSKLIEEFILIDSGGSAITSACTINDLLEDNEMYQRVLAETPNQLIRFAPIRRIEKTTKLHLDKRLLRISSKHSFPIGVWANWVLNHVFWQRCITLLILLDAALIGFQVEVNPKQYYDALQVARVIDQIVLVVFAIEIVLKWMDSFWLFWNDGWNVFDVLITVVSAIPEVLSLFAEVASIDEGLITKIRVVRVFRALKTIARFDALRIIVSATFKTLKAMKTIVQLLLILAFVYAVFGIYLFENYTKKNVDGYVYTHRFQHLAIAGFTLFQVLTYDHWLVMLEEIELVITPIVVVIYYVSWVFISAMVFRNLFIGVMVNNFSDISKKAKKREKQKKRKKQLDMYRHRIYLQMNKETNTAKKNKPKSKAVAKAELAVAAIEQLKSQQDPNERNKDASLQDTFLALKNYLSSRPDGTFQWDKNMEQLVETISSSKSETLWNRDILFKYFLTMEQLQENMKEYQKLMSLAALALCDIHDS